jgi:hypothetical protein
MATSFRLTDKYSGFVTDSLGRHRKGLKGRRSSKSFGKAAAWLDERNGSVLALVGECP